MARFIDFSNLQWEAPSTGVERAVLADREHAGSQEMLAELIRLAGGGSIELGVPGGSDRYLFTLAGECQLSGTDVSQAFGPRAFAVLRQGERYSLRGVGAETSLVVSVVAPPPGVSRDTPGLSGRTLIARVAELPVVEEQESGKRRIYLVTETNTGSRRAHGMIVAYRGDTVTPLHHHPDAESLFVFLAGRGLVLIDRREVAVGPGHAVFFARGDRHMLRGVDHEGMEFLEFHIPGAYKVVPA